VPSFLRDFYHLSAHEAYFSITRTDGIETRCWVDDSEFESQCGQILRSVMTVARHSQPPVQWLLALFQGQSDWSVVLSPASFQCRTADGLQIYFRLPSLPAGACHEVTFTVIYTTFLSKVLRSQMSSPDHLPGDESCDRKALELQCKHPHVNTEKQR
jgi:hypothetical protein